MKHWYYPGFRGKYAWYQNWKGSTENGHSYAWDRHLSYDANQLYKESRNKQWELSVRLVKNANLGA